MHRIVDGIPVWGEHDQATLAQIRRCAADKQAARAALMADGHKGYSMPIGGVVAYRDAISPSGVGYDISCGILAVRADVAASDLKKDIGPVMDEIARTVVFGIGTTSGLAVDDPLFDDPLWKDIPPLEALRASARAQLGTVGSGNHFVDLFEDEEGRVWIGIHFGSRGFGFRIASGFLNLAAGRPFDARAHSQNMDGPATVLSLRTGLGEAYWGAMTLAGRYAYAGRDFVARQVLGVLGARSAEEVHNHHNFAWRETHDGEELIVVRKGATPAWPGQRGIIGGSMGDVSVIVEGVDSEESRAALRSTVHGAGRVMSRTQAAGKRRWKKGGHRASTPGLISREMMLEWLKREGVVLRGGGTDESPHVYRRLPDVLAAHQGTLRILHTLRPLGVAMAGDDVFDPYSD
ncbi:MAG TPA: RtcB family protein [Spirochaetia bacterium]|nr:RtcB family protein [Spirochaetia bacterium]